MDDRRGAPSGPFSRNRKSALDAVIEKYSKEVPEEDDVVDIFRECLSEDRGNLMNVTSENEFTQVLADFVLNSDIDWSSSSNTLTSSPSCPAGQKVPSQLFARLTDVGQKFSSPTADVQPSDSEVDPFVGCGSDATDLNSDCFTSSSRCSRNRVAHHSPHGQHQQHQQHQQQHQQHVTQKLQLPVEAQSNPYFLLSPSMEQCNAGRSRRSHRDASSFAAAARADVDVLPAVEHKGSSSSRRGRRQVSPENAHQSSPVRRTVSDCTQSYSFDCRPPAAPPYDSDANGRSSAARASHSVARRWPSVYRPKTDEHGSTQAVPGRPGIFTDVPSLRSSRPSATEAYLPPSPPSSSQEKAGPRSPTQPAKWSAVSAAVVAADQPTLAASAVSPLTELGSPGGPITSESLSSLGRFLPGERIAIYLRRFAEAADRQSPPILPPSGPSLSPDTATHHLTDCHLVKGFVVAETPLAVPSISCNDAFFFVEAGTGFAERQPISSTPAGPTATENASRVAHACHSGARRIMNSEAIVPSPSYIAGGVRLSRVIKAEPSGAAHCEVLTPSSSRSPTASGRVQPCRSALPAVPAASGTADGGGGKLAAPNRCHHQSSRVSRGRHDDGFGSSNDAAALKAGEALRPQEQSADDRYKYQVCTGLGQWSRGLCTLGSQDVSDGLIELDCTFVSASSNEVTWTAQAMPRPDGPTRFDVLRWLRESSSVGQGGRRRADSATQSVAARHLPVGHGGRRRESSDDSHCRSDSVERSADEQSEANRALVVPPDSVEATSSWGHDASPHVRQRRSSSDVASRPLPPMEFLRVEPPPGWRTGDSMPPSDEAAKPVLYKPPRDLQLRTHSTPILYTPPSGFGDAQAVDVQPQLPPATADCGRMISGDATPSTKPITQRRWHEPVRLELGRPRERHASPVAVDQEFTKAILSWSMARKSMACDHQAMPQALSCCWSQQNDRRLGRCISCGCSTPTAAGAAAAAAHVPPQLFGASGCCSQACSSYRT